MISQMRPYMPRGMERTETVEQPSGPVEKSVKTPEAAAQKPPPVQTERLVEVLQGYAMKATEENIALLKTMLENGIPLTKENILHMNHAVKLAGSSDNALFMVQNDMKLTQSNAAQLDGLVKGQIRITEQLDSLMKAIDQLEDAELASKLKEILAGMGKNNAPQGQAVGQGAQQGAMPSAEATAAQQQAPQVLQTAQTAVPESGEAATATPQANQPTAASQPAANQSTSPTPDAPQIAQQNAATPQAQASANQGQAATQTAGQTGQAPQASQAPTQPGQIAQAPLPSGVAGEPATQAQISSQPQSLSQIASQLQAQAQAAAKPPLPGAQQSGAQPAQSQQPPPTLPQNLLFQLANSTAEDIGRYLNNLRDTMTQVQQALGGRESDDVSRVLQEARAVEAQIDFTSQIKNQTYVQLPLFYNGQESQATLHVYKDAKKSANSGTGASSALIALETSGMGHFETYVQKNANSVHCQFRLENDKIVQAVRDNIHKLDALLKNHEYSLDSFSFLPPGEPYTLLDKPKNLDFLDESKTSIHHFDKKA